MVDPLTPSGVPGPFAALGLTFVVLTMFGFGLVAIGAGALNARLAARPSLSAWLHKGAGAILMLLGLRLIWAER